MSGFSKEGYGAEKLSNEQIMQVALVLMGQAESHRRRSEIDVLFSSHPQWCRKMPCSPEIYWKGGKSEKQGKVLKVTTLQYSALFPQSNQNICL